MHKIFIVLLYHSRYNNTGGKGRKCMIKAVIFDMDGLMFNTEVMFKKQFREALDFNHIDAPDSVIEEMIGCVQAEKNVVEENRR